MPIQASPFFGSQGDGSISDDLFFSFVTLTTTGYGNLVPSQNPGQSLAVMEAVVGQLFLVTAVAKIVTAWHPAQMEQRSGGGAVGRTGGPVARRRLPSVARPQLIPARTESTSNAVSVSTPNAAIAVVRDPSGAPPLDRDRLPSTAPAP